MYSIWVREILNFHMIGTEIFRVSLYSLKGIISLSEFLSIGSRLKQILFSPGKGHNLGKRSETKKHYSKAVQNMIFKIWLLTEITSENSESNSKQMHNAKITWK